MESNIPENPERGRASPSDLAAAQFLLTDLALKAARDCKSRRVVKRVRAAMAAVLLPQYRNTIPEETALMAALGGAMRVLADRESLELQEELYALGQISGKMQGQDIPDENIQMPLGAIGILKIWEEEREKQGIYRAAPDAIPDDPVVEFPKVEKPRLRDKFGDQDGNPFPEPPESRAREDQRDEDEWPTPSGKN